MTREDMVRKKYYANWAFIQLIAVLIEYEVWIFNLITEGMTNQCFDHWLRQGFLLDLCCRPEAGQ